MVTITIADTKYAIPTSWKDITYERFCKIYTWQKKDAELTEDEALLFLSDATGIDYKIVAVLPTVDCSKLLGLLSFVSNYDYLKCSFVLEEKYKLDIGSKEWWRLEKAKQAMQNKGDYLLAAGDVIKVYFDEDISQRKLTDVFGLINYMGGEMDKFFEAFKELNEYEEDEDEYMAGGNRLSRFGFFASNIELARSFGVLPDIVLNMEARVVYNIFLYDFTKSQIQKRLMEIKSRKK